MVNQLLQLDYHIENPFDLLHEWEENAAYQLRENSFLQDVVRDLKRHLPEFRAEIATIVHGDARHSNFVITTSGLIYLVDWDFVRLTDRMYDVAQILSHYIPLAHWPQWLSYYGYKNNDLVLDKIYWYGQFSYLTQISKFFDNRDLEHANREIYELRKFRETLHRY